MDNQVADNVNCALAGRRVQTLVDNLTKHGKLRLFSLNYILLLFTAMLDLAAPHRVLHLAGDFAPPTLRTYVPCS